MKEIIPTAGFFAEAIMIGLAVGLTVTIIILQLEVTTIALTVWIGISTLIWRLMGVDRRSWPHDAYQQRRKST